MEEVQESANSDVPSASERWRHSVNVTVGQHDTAASKVAKAAKLAHHLEKLNSGGAFSAAFGCRSLSGKLKSQALGLSEEDEGSKETTDADAGDGGLALSRHSSRGPRISWVQEKEDADLTSSLNRKLHSISPGEGEGGKDNGRVDVDRIATHVRLEYVEGAGWRVTSALAENFTIQPQLEFKMSQFLRTILYEALPVNLGYFACVLTEMFVFGHTLDEAMCCASARMLIPFPCPGPLKKVFITVDGKQATHHIGMYVNLLFWLPVLAVCFLKEVQHYIEPMEIVPMVILQCCRVLVLSCKYALLPTSYVDEKMYRRTKDTDVLRTLVGTCWLSPKDEGHADLLKMEMENACLQADVDLSETQVDLGSTRAAMVVRFRARGVGMRTKKQVSNTPSVVSGKELLAALIDTYIGKSMPMWLNMLILAVALIFASVLPICHSLSGMPAFGGTQLSKATAAMIFIYSVFIFMNNLTFTSACVWSFHRRYEAMESLNNMVSYPGEPSANFVPPSKPKSKPKPTKRNKKVVAEDEGVPAKPTPEEEDGEVEEEEEESAEMRAMQRAAREGATILVDLKHPSSCLCWSLVRRSMRHVGSSWTRRLNCFSVVFLAASFLSAGILQILYYSAGRDGGIPHRLASAASLYFLAIVISTLVSLAVIEASAINDLVPQIRMWLKRETVALAAQLAQVEHAEAQENDKRARQEDAGGGATRPSSSMQQETARMRSAFRLIECVDQCVHHEEEEADPIEVFYKIRASPAAITATISSLLSMLLVATQRLFTMIESEGWSYGDMGEFGESDAF